MKITPTIRYKYMVERGGVYYKGMDPMRKYGDVPQFSGNRSDGKKFDTIAAAREISRDIGGSEIVRVDMLNGDVVDVRELMKAGAGRDSPRLPESPIPERRRYNQWKRYNTLT